MNIDRINSDINDLKVITRLFSEDESKSTLKYSVVNVNKVKEKDPHRTVQSLALQRSKYITVDNDLERLKKTNAVGYDMNSQQRKELYYGLKGDSINLRFC